MRISKIKLAGFKSFVDPTTLTLPGNLTGVVGPNGCGKSNIIDALMWVMGESSAKQLRGDSMADVIFNGSNSRKPVGQASVELIFDNSDGTLGGQYAGYGEIAIKRSITRDGISNYQLNGTRCRRKDVTNVFLGTGLGSRGGYSVIEQGMISRVVEAKPEELRGFLEEAAGISKYKERRRETENRIRHTKENIERLDDIREEITKQLSHLQRQANAAERYQILKQDERRTDAQLLALRWRVIDQTRARHAETLAQQTTKLEAAVADLRGIEATQTEKREGQTQASDLFNQVQSEFYAKSAEISRLEQALQHAEERKTELETDLQRARESLGEVQSLLSTDRSALDGLEQQIQALEPGAEAHDKAADEASAALQQAEERASGWQSQWDDFNRERAEVVRREHAEQVRLEHLREALTGAQARLRDLHIEKGDTQTVEIESALNETQHALREAEAAHDELLRRRDTVKASLQDARARAIRHGDELHELRSQLQSLTGTESSLRALQDAALRQDESALQTWLSTLGLEAGGLLAEQIEIDRGWETAVETAIRVPLGAICQSGSLNAVFAAGQGGLPPVAATLLDQGTAAHVAAGPHGLTPLAAKVRSKWPVADLLAGIYAVEELHEAQAALQNLAAHESVITRSGHWFGANWVQVQGEAQTDGGILERERRLDEIRGDLREVAQAIDAAETEFDSAQNDAEAGEERESEIDEALQQAIARTTELKTTLARQEANLERLRERAADIAREMAALEERSTGGESAVATALGGLQSIRTELGEYEAKNDDLVAARAAVQAQLDHARTSWREAREARHETALKLESLRASRESLTVACARNEQQVQELAARCTDLETTMNSTAAPQKNLRAELETALAARLQAEERLADARRTLENFEAEIKHNDEARMQAERAVEEQRELLDQARLDERTIQVQLKELEQRLGQTEFVTKELLEELDESADEAGWQEKLEKIRQRINRLGPINLAAIDEFSKLSERKEYLDSQNNDLLQALETLEGAIRKIDRETRTRFKETFDKVNTGMQTMFPVLFGGGHAYLELTGDDLLETGVTVMARPPGKRNSTIHLLSGGEKALTALAFVFSLFELNPAPFCLLDEVDAPLDDANVVRLSKMLKTMSQTVQFLCITHNKITMETTEQLIGVTMQEAGVSRLVTVNMEEAVEMAAAS